MPWLGIVEKDISISIVGIELLLINLLFQFEVFLLELLDQFVILLDFFAFLF